MASVQKKGPNRHLLIVSDGFDAAGKRKRHTRMFHGTDKQADKAAVLFEQEVKEGRYCAAGKDYTLAEFVKVWEEDYAGRYLEPKTLYRYKEMLDKRILPLIGHLRMDKIRPMTINRLVKDLEDSPRLDGKSGGLSAQTIKHHFRCLSAILQDAVEWDVIPSNPCARVKSPRVKKSQAKCYDEDQASALLKALQDESLKHQTLTYLAIASGARQGEIMGLEWRHIDFDANTIRVEQSSQYLPGRGVITKEPKNEASKRTISMPQNVMDLLRAYRAEWLEDRLKVGDLWQGSDRLFTTWDGRPMHPPSAGQWFKRFLKRHGLPHVRFHSLRHLSATLLIREGVPLKNISKRLGHTVYATTADIYSHALESVDRVAADKFETLLTGGLQKERKGKKHG